jgi:signal transduction histidine kinase
MELSLMLSGMCKSGMKMIDVANYIIATKPFHGGTMVIEKTYHDVGGLLREVRDAYSPAIGRKGLALVSKVDDGLLNVKIDREWISRALYNLMQNAINYTPVGGMISLNAETTLSNMLAIQVSDSGCGIPREEHDKIFRKYYRSAAAKGTKGDGIGLAIVSEVACAHGGYVELESIEGVGSTFTLYLPA